MINKKNESFFWTSFSDLMTSMFFIMLVLFVLTAVLLEKRRKATEAQIRKIEEIESAINQIDSSYFGYNKEYKKHILKIDIGFPVGESDIMKLDRRSRNDLIKAGKEIRKTLNEVSDILPEIKYLLVIEGQASKDDFSRNYELSYERALSLSRFWEENSVRFGSNCEVLISGSGIGGVIREEVESKNQRFLIQILPKPGVINEMKKAND